MHYPDITLSDRTIHNPNEPRHFLRAKPVKRLVRIRRGDCLLAESIHALRVTEVANDVYDPVFYIPKTDILVPLKLVPGKATHCPLKGDASYYTVPDGAEIAWSYETPFDFIAIIAERVAFYPDEVVVEEIGSKG